MPRHLLHDAGAKAEVALDLYLGMDLVLLSPSHATTYLEP